MMAVWWWWCADRLVRLRCLSAKLTVDLIRVRTSFVLIFFFLSRYSFCILFADIRAISQSGD